jgi:hypothetical protein
MLYRFTEFVPSVIRESRKLLGLGDLTLTVSLLPAGLHALATPTTFMTRDGIIKEVLQVCPGLLKNYCKQ